MWAPDEMVVQDMKSAPTRIGSVSRAIQLLVVLAETPMDVRKPRVLADAAGFTLSSAYHLLNTFEDSGLLSKDTSGCYQFGPTFAFLAEAHHRSGRLPATVVARVRELAARTGESAYFSAWRHGKIEMLMSELGSNAVHVAVLPSGSRGVEHARASGKLLLALSDDQTIQNFLRSENLNRVTDETITDPATLMSELVKIREQGYATELEEFIVGVGCASAPVYALGRVFGAITISAPIERFRNRENELVTAVCQAAADVEIVVPDSSHLAEAMVGGS
ncbi:IclR family transcriptional regulator [Georgenia yuyongxinii]|uniref:IclR family transcriptional regulator n=3 Tax=Georgenia yuyongxinii TaxID=2589797 RepID=A0A5B8C5P7_9MICO|nr:IclR family transcriptional regulator [Georgenia yuyongxinii]